jgi:ABC-2 type transport system ATP-binding protein
MSVTVENIAKKYGGKHLALDELSLTIDKGIFCLLGPNGAGKTTFVNILCGLLKRDSGKVSIFGMDPNEDIQKIRKQIGLVTQETALYEYLTAYENLQFHARFYGIPKSHRKEKIADALELAQLENRAKDLVHTFSGGMKRRLALVRSLMHNPELIILDEPTLGIDVQNRNEIWNRILDLKKDKTVIVNTNYMDEADRLGDTIAIIDHGKLIEKGKPNELKQKHAGGTRLEAIVLAKDDNVAEMEQDLKSISPELHLSIIEQSLDKNEYQLTLPADKPANELLTEASQIFKKHQNIELLNVNIRVPTLDDVFLELTGSRLRD